MASYKKKGEIDLSNQVLNQVNIHTISSVLKRYLTKHWELLNLSNCCMGMSEIEWLCTKSGALHIDELDLSYNNVTQFPPAILAKLLLTWDVKILRMGADENDEIVHGVITNTINNFTEIELKQMRKTEVYTNNQNFLIICMYNYEDIITEMSSSDSKCSKIHLSFCQLLGMSFSDVARVVNLLAEKSSSLWLHNCNASFPHVLATVTKSKISSFHYYGDSIISSKVAIEELTQLAITLGENIFPLHLYDRAFFFSACKRKCAGKFEGKLLWHLCI